MFLQTNGAEAASPIIAVSEEGNSSGLGDSNASRRHEKTRAHWLEEEILPHEAAVRQMLRHEYPKVDASEVVQSTYLRLMATSDIGHVNNSKWYFFMTARSVVRDQARRDRVVGFEPLDPEAQWATDEPAIEAIIDSRRALQRFYDAVDRLPPRERMVFKLRRIEGLCIRATAERLATSESSVEKHQKHAMRRLVAAMAQP